MCVISASERWRQEDQECKVFLDYTEFRVSLCHRTLFQRATKRKKFMVELKSM